MLLPVGLILAVVVAWRLGVNRVLSFWRSGCFHPGGPTIEGMMVWPALQRPIFSAINDFASETPWLHGLARVYAEDGVVLFGALLLVAWWVSRSHGRDSVTAALWAPLGTLLAVGLNQPIVHAVSEPRPYTVLPHALTLVSRSTDPSFPSDHATMAGAVAVGVWLANRRLGIVATALALLMALTRVYVGAHWPLDVVAGLVVGAAVCLVGYAAVRRLIAWIVLRLEATPLRPLLESRSTAPRA